MVKIRTNVRVCMLNYLGSASTMFKFDVLIGESHFFVGIGTHKPPTPSKLLFLHLKDLTFSLKHMFHDSEKEKSFSSYENMISLRFKDVNFLAFC